MRKSLIRQSLTMAGVFAILRYATEWLPDFGGLLDIITVLLAVALWLPIYRWLAQLDPADVELPIPDGIVTYRGDLTKEQADAIRRRWVATTHPIDSFSDRPGTARVLAEIETERLLQVEKWGEQHHPDGTGPQVPFTAGVAYMHELAARARRATKAAAGEIAGLKNHGPLTWRHILLEEVFEALAEADPFNLRTELIQVGAVAVAWAEAIDLRPSRAENADA